YSVLVTNAAGSVMSMVATLTVLIPPVITNQPVSQTVAAGGSVSFQVSASGTSPFGYQWLFDRTNVIGSCTNFLVLGSVQLAQAGNYSVVVTNIVGAVTSSVASLTVGLPPTVVQQPVSLVVTQGQKAAFTVAGDGSFPLGYQWRFNGVIIDAARASSFT